MVGASVAAVVARPSSKLAEQQSPMPLETLIPSQFGSWEQVPAGHGLVVNPQAKKVLDRLYSDMLARTYVDRSGYRIMVAVAYGTDQRRALQVHKPEICYPAQGFAVHKNREVLVPTPFGEIAARRLFATKGTRHEPLTYWFTVGDHVVQGKLQKRLVELRYGLTGRIPDGLILRVSSIDTDETRAYRLQDQFISEMLAVLSAAQRKRLSGLGPRAGATHPRQAARGVPRKEFALAHGQVRWNRDIRRSTIG